MSSNSALWTSKLGSKYPKEEIDRLHDQTMKELVEMRRSTANALCADCGQQGTVWSSVNLGVFLCLRCGSLHRALGTHISKPKGCTGTYLWGADEIARMKEIGNARSHEIYGGIHERPSKDAPDSEWLEYIRQKYEERKFAPCQKQAVPSDMNDTKASRGARPTPTRNDTHETAPSPIVPTGNLIDQDNKVEASNKDCNDFFAEFGL